MIEASRNVINLISFDTIKLLLTVTFYISSKTKEIENTSTRVRNILSITDIMLFNIIKNIT